ncbi:hypothetical protein N657DRAFT_92464 [Parathielavia appendiculata]|uniref:Uncharacterized protein n=1 Tax=Parathielavia appendiculata TaxID=2587402 RepID=A0AAN6UB40_9PEZI|nr:hypothetical protein N657DRAFT_92464 [Parathielavia appendiculata]
MHGRARCRDQLTPRGWSQLIKTGNNLIGKEARTGPQASWAVGRRQTRESGGLGKQGSFLQAGTLSLGGKIWLGVVGLVLVDCSRLTDRGQGSQIEIRRREAHSQPSNIINVRLFVGQNTGGWLRTPNCASPMTAMELGRHICAMTPNVMLSMSGRSSGRAVHSRCEHMAAAWRRDEPLG